jgi:hypothetical protein
MFENIPLTLTINRWPNVLGLEHVATEWEVLADSEANVVLESSGVTDVYLNVYYSSISIPVGETYYKRVKRHFLDENGNASTSAWSTPSPLQHVENNVKDTIKPYMLIDKPIINALHNTTTNSLEIAGSSFRGVGTGHSSTTYIILDRNDRCLYSNMYNTVDLTCISIPIEEIDADLETTPVKIAVAYNGVDNVESGFAFTILSSVETVFGIISNLKSVKPYTDKVINYKMLNNSASYYFKLILRDSTDTVIWESELENKLNITIPGGYLTTDRTYYIDSLYSVDGKLDRLINIRNTLTTTDTDKLFEIDPYFTYNNSYTQFGQYTFNMSNFNVVGAVDDNIMLPNFVDNTIDIFKLEDSNLIKTKSVDTVGLVNLQPEHAMNVIRLDNNTVILDEYKLSTDTNELIPVFNVYKYNKDYNRFDIIANVERPDESTNTTQENNIVVLPGGNKVIYVAKDMEDTTKLAVVDFTEGTVVYKDFLDEASTNVNIDALGGDKLLIRADEDTYIYDVSLGIFQQGPAIPEDFKEIELRSFSGKDSNVYYFRNNFTGLNDNVDILKLDNKTYKYSVIELPNLLGTNITSTIRMQDGSFLRFDDSENKNIFIFS